MGDAPFLSVEEISKTFHSDQVVNQVLDSISFTIQRGETIALLGESGCGKSTLLNIIGGFEKPDHGFVKLQNEPITKPSRKAIMLFQHYGLLPWKSALKNVEFGLESSSLSAKERAERARHYLDLVGLSGKSQMFPHEVSGGMKQRIAIARALAPQPELILMDEPFAALDTFNRYHLQDQLLNIQAKEQTTIVLVTHDIDEAIYLADRIFIMHSNPGRIHHEIHVELSKPRDRSHPDFYAYRKQILDEFHFSRQESAIEFHI
ncbi:ABC transporter ATP-binding protein [Chryseomicrobium aureum]|uniref:ABC transporter ATP-binding protein n=1 Tax=Chryseomicrobium aureum TaxID=1441723 RepID=UPI003598CF54